MSSSAVSIGLQVIAGLGLLNVWLVRPKSATAFRGGSAQSLREEFVTYGLPEWCFYAVGGAKIVSAVLLIIGIWVPQVVVPAALVGEATEKGCHSTAETAGTQMKANWPGERASGGLRRAVRRAVVAFTKVNDASQVRQERYMVRALLRAYRAMAGNVYQNMRVACQQAGDLGFAQPDFIQRLGHADVALRGAEFRGVQTQAFAHDFAHAHARRQR
jgi:hypothetical protein